MSDNTTAEEYFDHFLIPKYVNPDFIGDILPLSLARTLQATGTIDALLDGKVKKEDVGAHIQFVLSCCSFLVSVAGIIPFNAYNVISMHPKIMRVIDMYYPKHSGESTNLKLVFDTFRDNSASFFHHFSEKLDPEGKWKAYSSMELGLEKADDEEEDSEGGDTVTFKFVNKNNSQ